MYKLGLDLGSSYTKGVLVDADNKIIDYMSVKTGYDFQRAAKKVIDKFAANHEIEYPVYTCGYGREQLSIEFIADSEIIALAKAVFDKYKRATVVIDIGGQDTKYIKIAENGTVDKFKLNRKCAAGTGSFLEEIAFRLDIPAEDFNELAEQATEKVKLNSYCTVFAISEIVGLIKKGSSLANIVLGVYNSIIDRALEMAPIEDSLILTGGIPENHPAIVELFKKINPNTIIPEKAQFLAAYGSILLNV